MTAGDQVAVPLRRRVPELLAGPSAERGPGLVLVSHDLDAVAAIRARSLVLASGRVVRGRPRGCSGIRRTRRPASSSSPAPACPTGPRHERLPAAAGSMLAALVAGGLLRDPLVSAHARLSPPSWAPPFGADASGRDLLARVGHGALVTLGVAGLILRNAANSLVDGTWVSSG
ncbi:MAG: hypothetical protein ABWX68_13405 [Arthrobacter sp.]